MEKRGVIGFFICFKDVKCAKDIPVKDKGKHEELAEVMYARLFVNLERYLFGKVDCQMLALLGIKDEGNRRNYDCYYDLTVIVTCWHMYARYISSTIYLYSECICTHEYYEYCYELHYISSTGEDEETNPDSEPSGGERTYAIEELDWFQPQADPLDLSRSLDCFKNEGSYNSGTEYEVTLYVRQPTPGSDDTYRLHDTGHSLPDVDAGHTFVNLSQYSPNGTNNGIESMSKLEKITLDECKYLISLDGLESINSLRKLLVVDCKSLNDYSIADRIENNCIVLVDGMNVREIVSSDKMFWIN